MRAKRKQDEAKRKVGNPFAAWRFLYALKTWGSWKYNLAQTHAALAVVLMPLTAVLPS